MAVDASQAVAEFLRVYGDHADYPGSRDHRDGADVCDGPGAGTGIRVARAPGRVNLIGEHTDYSEGFVLPVAIDYDVAIAFRPRKDRVVRLYSAHFDESSEFSLDDIRRDYERPWSNYFRGVAAALSGLGGHGGLGIAELGAGMELAGVDAAIIGDIPQGAGLSSSAAFEVASALALLSAAGASDEVLAPGRQDVRRQIALACQAAENSFVGVMCGIMDQMASIMGRRSHAVFIDCRTLGVEMAPMPLDEAGVALVVYDTGVVRGLVESEYNRRRAEVEDGVGLISRALGRGRGAACGIRTLRDVTSGQFETIRRCLPPIIAARCEHVIAENERVLAAVKALRAGNLGEFGRLMYQSHDSLSRLYQVSCPELDRAVEIARSVPGVIGSRMTGGGFGGCTISLVRRSAAPALMSKLTDGDPSAAARAFVVEVSDGALLDTYVTCGRTLVPEHWR